MREVITGGTVYWLDDGADTGPIAAQDWCWITPGDTDQSLWREKLAPMGLRLIEQVLTQLDQGICPRAEQQPEMATWEPAFDRPRLGLPP